MIQGLESSWKDAGMCNLRGHGDGIHFITGFYIELNFISDPPCYRRIRDSGTWCDQLLRYDAARSQWTIADFGPPPKLRAAAVARNPPLQAWEGQEWHLEGSEPCWNGDYCVWDAGCQFQLYRNIGHHCTVVLQTQKLNAQDGGLQIQKRTLNQLSKDARREAKEDLYAHLCLFHRRSPQYYELHERYWNESVAEALRDREETSEELLHKFADFMKKHGYEKKILGNGQGML
eukprot:s1202_g5.t1